MTSPAELETWLGQVYPEAVIESRPVNYLMRPNLGDELNEYQLFLSLRDQGLMTPSTG